jgi:DNA topoisomerase-1
LIKIDNKKAEVNDEKTAKQIVAELKRSKYSVIDVKKREVKRGPYPPLTTSTMTQAAARLLSWSAKRTMSVAQKLYEEGLITYHRTDSVHLAKPAVDKVRVYIREEYGDKYIPEKSRFYRTRSKLAQEAHEAIRPTKVEITSDKCYMNLFGSDLWHVR